MEAGPGGPLQRGPPRISARRRRRNDCGGPSKSCNVLGWMGRIAAFPVARGGASVRGSEWPGQRLGPGGNSGEVSGGLATWSRFPQASGQQRRVAQCAEAVLQRGEVSLGLQRAVGALWLATAADWLRQGPRPSNVRDLTARWATPAVCVGGVGGSQFDITAMPVGGLEWFSWSKPPTPTFSWCASASQGELLHVPSGQLGRWQLTYPRSRNASSPGCFVHAAAAQSTHRTRASDGSGGTYRPLAARLRPKTLTSTSGSRICWRGRAAAGARWSRRPAFCIFVGTPHRQNHPARLWQSRERRIHLPLRRDGGHQGHSAVVEQARASGTRDTVLLSTRCTGSTVPAGYVSFLCRGRTLISSAPHETPPSR